MKIGVDARLLSKSITGIGRYTLEMCRALSRLEGVTLYLYSPSPIDSEISKIFKSSVIRTSTFNKGIFRQIWSETYLPLWAKQDDVDVFWGPAHRLPRWLPSKIPRVVTIHDLVWKYAGETMRPFSRILETYQSPAAINSADHIVAISHATADSISDEFHLQSNRLTVVPLGSDHLPTVVDDQLLENMGIVQPYFLFVGTLEPRKNLISLLNAYSRLPESARKKTSLVIAGGAGWGGVDLQNTIKDLNLSPYVKLVGYVDEPTLCALYANARFLAMPSLYEGFGLPLVEAMSYGIPVLTSNNSSMIEVAGNAGILVDPLDVDSIKDGVMALITNDELHRNFAENAVKNATRYNWQLSASQLLRVFQGAIEEKKVLS